MADHEELLRILQEQGEKFLSSFSGSVVQSRKRKLSTLESDSIVDESTNADDVSEWEGIRSEEENDNEQSEGEDYEENDDEFVAGSSFNPDVVVFSERSKSQPDPRIRAHMKSFMSSKTSKLRDEIDAHTLMQIKPEQIDEDERTNLQNDALLHKLVHTKLLSGSLNSELDLTAAERRRALSGRVLELAGNAKLGRGEKSVRVAERNKASKQVREGLVRKERERQKARLEEAKNLGNYAPALKKIFTSDEAPKPKKRARGLKMGVGRFSGGTLKLSQDEIKMVQGQSGGGIGRGRGRGGKGRGRK